MEKQRKEISLDNYTIEFLQKEADEQNRSLKAHIEFILKTYVEKLKPIITN